MMQVTPLFEGKPTELAGLFQGGEDRSFIVLNVGLEDPWSVIFHEYAHRLLDGNVAFRMDPWFEEGLAEYSQALKWTIGKPGSGRFRNKPTRFCS